MIKCISCKVEKGSEHYSSPLVNICNECIGEETRPKLTAKTDSKDRGKK